MNGGFILFDIACPAEIADILIAGLGILDVDSFLEKDTGFEFSIPKDHPGNREILDQLEKFKTAFGITFSETAVEKTDWNREWENNFQPVNVDNKVLIRAPFHTPDRSFKTEIIVSPKMSFGTGHHETTYMMIQAMMTIGFKNRTILDAGCGTGILSIFARKNDSGPVTAIDIDDWAVSNAAENISLNNVAGITVIKGTIANIPAVNKFGVVLANINRNVLLKELPAYARRQESGADMILSGFYEKDAGSIREMAIKCGYRESGSFARNGWSALAFKRNSDYFS